MNISAKTGEIKDLPFVGNSAMLLSLTNDRTLTVPLDKFKEIAALSSAVKSDFEVIDGEKLSFLALDEIYSIQDLIGLWKNLKFQITCNFKMETSEEYKEPSQTNNYLMPIVIY